MTLFLLALLLLVVGHTVVWISLINRMHAMPMQERTLRKFRHLHDFIIPLFPFLLAYHIGFSQSIESPATFWEALPTFLRPIVAASVVGLVWLGWIMIRTATVRAPVQQTGFQAQRHDIAAELNQRPVAPGPYHLLTRLPFNEQFQLEYSEKVFTLPGLPAAWDGLSILHLSDWHLLGTVAKEYYVRVSEISASRPVDLVCFTGDLIDQEERLAWLPETLGRFQAPLGLFFILGNHDWYHSPDTVRRRLAEMGWTDLGGKSVTLEHQGRVLNLSGDETPWMGDRPSLDADADFRLLLSHTPDHFEWAREQGADLMLAGHTHGGQVRLPLVGPIYAPSRYGTKYASGTFFKAPTLMHVSRGLAGQHPLRWRCCPEVTRIILKSC